MTSEGVAVLEDIGCRGDLALRNRKRVFIALNQIMQPIMDIRARVLNTHTYSRKHFMRPLKELKTLQHDFIWKDHA